MIARAMLRAALGAGLLLAPLPARSADAGAGEGEDAGAPALDGGADAGPSEPPGELKQLPTWIPAELDPQASPASDSIAQRMKQWRASVVIIDPARGTRMVLGKGDPTERRSPCSTFKIFHALVGLETGVLKGLDHVYKWDEVDRGRSEWNQDLTLQSAISYSAVWYFQRLATELGPAREQQFLGGAHYGNEDSSSGLTDFWINGSLAISPEEQVDFLERMLGGHTPFSARAVSLVSQALVVTKTERAILHGKTGSCGDGKLAWFVGWVEPSGEHQTDAGERPTEPAAKKGSAAQDARAAKAAKAARREPPPVPERRIFAVRLEALPLHVNISGPGDARPLAEEILAALGML